MVHEFNRAQREMAKGTCGPTAATEWLKKFRPKTALHSSMTDYCDTCKQLKEELSRVQAIRKRLQQSGSAPESELKEYEEKKVSLEVERKQHKKIASEAREFFNSCMEKCKQHWRKITKLTSQPSLITTEREELKSLQHCFTLTISADYQQAKLIPSWGASEQPGSTYYLQKVSHDIFGIVDHREEKGFLYLFDERIGPKNTDHTISFLMKYWSAVPVEHSWIHRLHIFLDNATSTNKNRYLFSWAMEMVSNGNVQHLHISFMIAGHTKFAPDRLFATVGSAYKTSDVFTVDELQALCSRSAMTWIEDGENVLTWRESLGQKYSDLPGVRKLHDFLFVHSHTGEVVMKVRELCYAGAWNDSTLKVLSPALHGIPSTNYKDTQTRRIKDDKMAHMVTMYDKFISLDRRPSYLLAFQPSLLISRPIVSISSSLPASASCTSNSGTTNSGTTQQRK